MATHNLAVRSRTETGKEAAKRLRRTGQIPAVAYGHKEAPVKLSVDAKELRDLLAHHASKGLLLLKNKDGVTADVPVIIKDLQQDYIRHTVQSVDFLRVSLDEEVTAKVTVHLVGEPIGVKMNDGVLVQALHELEIAARPESLLEEIKVDISSLEMGGAPIHVHQIEFPAGVRCITDGEQIVAVVNPPRVEEVLEEIAVEAVDPAVEAEAAEDAETEA